MTTEDNKRKYRAIHDCKKRDHTGQYKYTHTYRPTKERTADHTIQDLRTLFFQQTYIISLYSDPWFRHRQMVFVQKFDVYTFLGNPSGAILMFFYAATTRPTTWAREDSMERLMSQRNKTWQSNSGGESHHVCLYESGTVSKSEVSFFSAISFWIFPTTCNFDFGHLWCHRFQLVAKRMIMI